MAYRTTWWLNRAYGSPIRNGDCPRQERLLIQQEQERISSGEGRLDECQRNTSVPSPWPRYHGLQGRLHWVMLLVGLFPVRATGSIVVLGCALPNTSSSCGEHLGHQATLRYDPSLCKTPSLDASLQGHVTRHGTDDFSPLRKFRRAEIVPAGAGPLKVQSIGTAGCWSGSWP